MSSGRPIPLDLVTKEVTGMAETRTAEKEAVETTVFADVDDIVEETSAYEVMLLQSAVY